MLLAPVLEPIYKFFCLQTSNIVSKHFNSCDKIKLPVYKMKIYSTDNDLNKKDNASLSTNGEKFMQLCPITYMLHMWKFHSNSETLNSHIKPS